MTPLVRLVLIELTKIEGSLIKGESTLVRPYVPGLQGGRLLISPGYDYRQIDDVLRYLAQRGYIDTGGAAEDAWPLGVAFASVTPSGKQLMSEMSQDDPKRDGLSD